jgi:hypothetical protein
MVSKDERSVEEHTVDKVHPGKIAEKMKAQGECQVSLPRVRLLFHMVCVTIVLSHICD